MTRVAIIGGGASGVVCAAEIAHQCINTEITIFERLPKLLKKVLVTGNGRCNFTNTSLSPAHFYGDYDFIKSVLISPYSDTENYFRSIGILPYYEDGRIYPRSQQSASVREALLNQLKKKTIKIKLEHEVRSVSKTKNGYLVDGIFYDAVVICGGGKASPVHGSNGTCYSLLTGLGHTVTPLYPALCGLTTSEKFINTLKGVRVECEASLYDGDTLLGKESGEVQFTEKAVSGIPVMNLSHLCKNNKSLSIRLDICEELTEKELEEHMLTLKSNEPDTTLECALSGICNAKLGYVIIKNARISQDTPIKKLSSKEISAIISELKCFSVKIDKTKDFDTAQITCGGIKTTEIHPQTMMSTLNKGLFICGEVLDLHGDCGGYNLHLAWTTGRIAAYGVTKYLKG